MWAVSERGLRKDSTLQLAPGNPIWVLIGAKHVCASQAAWVRATSAQRLQFQTLVRLPSTLSARS